MSPQRVFVAIGLCAVVAFTFITPPFQVPDEVGHFWRAETIAHGNLFPRIGPKGAVARLPNGYSWLVVVFWRQTAGRPEVKFTWPQFRSAPWVPIDAARQVEVTFPAGYTPVPYLPQIVVALAGRVLHLRPAVTFYIGRLANALAYLAIIAAAIRMAPILRWGFAAAGLLPMALYLAASWSPDAMTIASVFFFTAALLRQPATALLAVSGAVVGLCKPAYFLVVLLVFAIPAMRGRARAAVLAATLIAVALAMWNAQRAFASVRTDVAVDPAAQVDCMRRDPARFPEALGTELRLRGLEYAEQAAGRLGMLDIRLPRAIIWAELLLLVLCALTGASAPQMRVRVIAAIVAIATIAGIFLSSYLGWTAPCARAIDGVQGRYFIPILPVILLMIAAPLVRRETFARIAVVAVEVVANVAAVAAVILRYYW